VRQSLGAAQLRAGQADAAERTVRDALATHPRDGRLLYGLGQALRAQRRASEAELVDGEFRRAWQTATVPLTLADL
jgi:Flp pilus assembly protein TadD